MQATATKTRRSAPVRVAPIVNYHGTITAMHGPWCVADNYGTHLKLRDARDNKMTCRRGSVTPITMPRFTEARAEALTALRASRDGRIAAGRIRTWLLNNGLIEVNVDRPGRYQLTRLGLIADEAIRPYWHGGMPAELAA